MIFPLATFYAVSCNVKTAEINQLLLTMDGHTPRSLWITGNNAGLQTSLSFPLLVKRLAYFLTFAGTGIKRVLKRNMEIRDQPGPSIYNL